MPSTEEVVKLLHATCGYLVKSTWIKAIKAGNFTGWPVINERTVNKYYPKTTETLKGRLNQSQKNVRPTKDKVVGKKRIISTAARAISQAKNQKQNSSETSARAKDFKTPNTTKLKGKKVRDVYTKVYDEERQCSLIRLGIFCWFYWVLPISRVS